MSEHSDSAPGQVQGNSTTSMASRKRKSTSPPLDSREPPTSAARTLSLKDTESFQDKETASHAQEPEKEEEIDHDDLCPICHLLLYRPVSTTCNHTLCESCMAHWADVSLSTSFTIVPLDEVPIRTPSYAVEAKCPMCRTLTTARLDRERGRELKGKYPSTYAERELEEREEGDESVIENLTLYIGNLHRLMRPGERHPGSSNSHDWTFFVKPSRTDIVKEVMIFLHPTFRPSTIIHTRPPYSIRRIGWGYFTITSHIILKPGYQWVSDEAFRAPDRREKAALGLDWTLSFDGDGRQGRCRLKFKKVDSDTLAQRARVVVQGGSGLGMLGLEGQAQAGAEEDDSDEDDEDFEDEDEGNEDDDGEDDEEEWEGIEDSD